jgi:LysR family transcriptional activator of nhaA
MLPFRVGVADSVPKSLAYRVVEPALQIDEAVRLICREGRLASLLADLAVHRLDMVIADRPMPAELKVRAYNHLLGSSNVAVFGAEAVVRRLTGAFPEMLDGAPFLLPGDGAAIRPALELWFDAHHVSPRIVGEFDDGALLKAFGQGAAGLFVAPSAIADYVCRQYGVQRLGDIDTVVEQVYAITTERRLRHPAMVAVSQAAAREVFGSTDVSGNAPGGKRLVPTHEPESSSGKRTRHSTVGAPLAPARPVSRKPNSRPALGDSRVRENGRKPRLRRGR